MQHSKSIILCIQWILITTLIYAIFIAITWSHMEAVVATSQETLFVGLFLSGLLCGLGQFRLIENRSPGTVGEGWIVINIFGMPLGLIVGFFVYFGIESFVVSVLRVLYSSTYLLGDRLIIASMVGIFFFAGVFLGILQWLVLRKKVEGAFWWIPISGLSWSLGFHLTFKLLNILLPIAWQGNHFRIGVLIGIIFGFIIGTVSAVTIAIMLNNPKESSQQIEKTLSNNAN